MAREERRACERLPENVTSVTASPGRGLRQASVRGTTAEYRNADEMAQVIRSAAYGYGLKRGLANRAVPTDGLSGRLGAKMSRYHGEPLRMRKYIAPPTPSASTPRSSSPAATAPTGRTSKRCSTCSRPTSPYTSTVSPTRGQPARLRRRWQGHRRPRGQGGDLPALGARAGVRPCLPLPDPHAQWFESDRSLPAAP
jgi:hypothetical protein